MVNWTEVEAIANSFLVLTSASAIAYAGLQLKHERQEEGQRAGGDAGQRAADHREAEGRDAHQAEVEHRVDGVAGVQHVGDSV